MTETISRMLDRYESGRLTRRELVRALGVLVAAARAKPAAASTFRGLELNHIALDVTDIARSRDFYQKLLGLPVLTESPTACFLGLGRHFLTLFKRDRAALDHYCIAIEGYDVRRVTEELKRQGLRPEQPGGTERVYFRDPDGLTVQLSSADHKP